MAKNLRLPKDISHLSGMLFFITHLPFGSSFSNDDELRNDPDEFSHTSAFNLGVHMACGSGLEKVYGPNFSSFFPLPLSISE